MSDNFEEYKNIPDEKMILNNGNDFKINQLKIEHFYWDLGDVVPGLPISTSVEIYKDFEENKSKYTWKEKISHTFLDINNPVNRSIRVHTIVLDNPENILNELEKVNLRELKNNYFSDEKPDCFTYWQITYNNNFKIVGTYNYEIPEYKKIKEILDFSSIVENELKKVKELLKNNAFNNGETWN